VAGYKALFTQEVTVVQNGNCGGLPFTGKNCELDPALADVEKRGRGIFLGEDHLLLPVRLDLRARPRHVQLELRTKPSCLFIASLRIDTAQAVRRAARQIRSAAERVDAARAGETLAQHRANPACASCHAKFDAFGLVFEGYGPVGETRTQDLAGRPVQIDATFPDGTSGNGLDGLRAFMRAKGQSKFVDNLCRQLLVYALGRSLLLSDEPLLAEMRKNLSTRGFKFGNLVQSIVTSRQFLTKQSMPGS